MAMSGGVDSSVAAALLKKEGYQVIGLHLKLYQGPEATKRIKSCCSLDEALDARLVCERLDIPFYILDFQISILFCKTCVVVVPLSETSHEFWS